MRILKREDYPRYTYEDYKNWEGRWEIIDGIAYAMVPTPHPKHQRVSNNIAWQLNELLKNCKKCKAYLPVDWKINENTVVQPDNLVLCYEVGNKPYITKAPTLIFEILSKSTAFKDSDIKYRLYEKEGVKYYVIVDTDSESAKVYMLRDFKFVKIADATEDKVKFDLEGCEIEFDFSLIWE